MTSASTNSATPAILDENRFFDVTMSYAKADAEDVCIRITVTNHGPDAAPIDVLPHDLAAQHLGLGPGRSAGRTMNQILPPTLTVGGLEAIEMLAGLPRPLRAVRRRAHPRCCSATTRPTR